jgi:hypothetical protein
MYGLAAARLGSKSDYGQEHVVLPLVPSVFKNNFDTEIMNAVLSALASVPKAISDKSMLFCSRSPGTKIPTG